MLNLLSAVTEAGSKRRNSSLSARVIKKEWIGKVNRKWVELEPGKTKELKDVVSD